MENKDNIEYTILFVDDEKSVLNSLKRLLRKENYKILTAPNGNKGFNILRSHEVQVVISDHRMPGMNGTEFLAEVKKEFPDIIRIILSGYTDIDALIDTINEGNIYKFFHKPWNDNNLILEIRQACEHYRLIQDNTRLSFQNKALVIYHAVINNIPIPLIGISKEKTIAIFNIKASGINFIDGKGLQIGSKINDIFPKNISTLINDCFNNNDSNEIKNIKLNGESYNIIGTPFKGNFADKGLVLSFMPDL
jgi:response regulator RpfG family c-di-GMP phosphodiesterase